MTIYAHRVTIAAPEHLMAQANHLAAIMGESAADIETFSAAKYQDANGSLYAVCSAVVTKGFLAAQTGGMPSTPAHAEAVIDRAKAQEAFDSLGQPGGLKMVIGDDPHAALEAMGLSIKLDEDTV